MSDLNIYTTTFNCGRTLLDVDHFAASLFNGLTTNLPPDLTVLSLQEIAPIGYCFLGGTLVAPYFERFTKAVNIAASGRGQENAVYEEIITRNVGMAGIMVFARPEIRQKIRRIETAGVGVGQWEMGNKGAVGVRLFIDAGEEDEAAVTFVAAHLAPMEWDWERRNADWQAICEGLIFEKDMQSGSRQRSNDDAAESEPLLPSSESEDVEAKDGENGLFSPVSHIFFFGDLNYRTSDTAPKPDDYKTWPQSFESLEDSKQYSQFFKSDQLTREMKKGKTCHNLAESTIKFAPTYKHSSAAQQTVSKGSQKPGGQTLLWAKHRIPSWCDRILYLAAAPPKIHSYTALPLQPTSDHRPVSLACSIPLKPQKLLSASVKPPFAIRKDWKEARAAAKRYEYAVGMAAYLGLTWEGEALLGGTIFGIIGGYLALRAMIGT